MSLPRPIFAGCVQEWLLVPVGAVPAGVLVAVQLVAVQLVAAQPDQVAERFMPTCCCTKSTSRKSNRLIAISVAGRQWRQSEPLREQEAKQVAEAGLRLEGLRLEGLLASATFWITRLWFAPSSLARTC